MFSLRDVMTASTPYVSVDLSVTEALAVIAEYGTPMPVCSSDRTLCGLITSRDLDSRLLARGLDPETTRIGDVVNSVTAATLEVDDSLETALFAMGVHSLSVLPVLEEGRLVGMVERSDLAKIPSQRQPQTLVA